MEALLAACCVGALNPTVLWSENYFDDAYNLVASGDNTYVAAGASGAFIYDVSVPASPKLLGACRTRGDARDVEVKATSSEGTLYVADDTMGMSVCDVTDPSSPRVIGTFDCPLAGCRVQSLEVVGTTAYLGDTNGEKVYIVNVADPTAPTLVGTYSATDRVYDVAVYNSFMYVAAGSGGLEVVNVANGAAPVFVAKRHGSGKAVRTVMVKSDVAYLGTINGYGVEMVDVSNPARPTLLGEFELAQRAYDFALWGTKLYAAVDGVGLVVLNVRDPAAIKTLSVYSHNDARGVTFRGSVVHMATLTEVVSIDLSNPSAPSLVGTLGTGGFVNMLHVVGDLAAIFDYKINEVRLYDVSVPSEPKLMSSVRTANEATVHIEGKYLYVGSYTRIAIYDITDPVAWVEVHVLPISRTVSSLKVVRSLLFVGDYNPGVTIYDISNRRSPVKLGTSSLVTYIVDLSVVGNTCWLGGTRLRALSINDPENPVLLSTTYVAGGVKEVVAVGTVVYVAAGTGGLQIFDVSNPEQPLGRGYYNLENAVALSLVGETVYVADDNNGLYIFDVSNLDAPKLLKHMLVDGSARDVFAVGTTVYMADYGLRIIDAAPEVITPEPTPAPTPVPTPAPTPAPTPEPTSEPLTDTEAPTTPAPQTPTEDDSSSDNALDDVPFWAWILIGVAVGACLGALIVFCACKKGDNPKSTPYP